MDLAPVTRQGAEALARWTRRGGAHVRRAAITRAGTAVLEGLRSGIEASLVRARAALSGRVHRRLIPVGRAASPQGGSAFMPEGVSAYLDSKTSAYLVYSLQLGGQKTGRRVRLRFGLEDLSAGQRVASYDEMAVRAFSWIMMCTKAAPATCARALDVFLLAAPHPKTLPGSSVQPLGPAHVNSGYSTSGCGRAAEIVVFRREEWFKVFVHETFHAFNLDAGAHAEQLKQVSADALPVRASHEVGEAYTETWARIVNVLYCTPPSASLEDVMRLLDLERAFGVAQASKILAHMGTSYTCIRAPEAAGGCGYREQTNVLAYYVEAGALMYNLGAFLDWAARHAVGYVGFRQRPAAVASFGQLLRSSLNSASYAQAIAGMSGWQGRSSRLSGLSRSLRMTLVECEN